VVDRHLLAWLSLAGIAFDLLGGLYLAYDLLGGRRGPLRTLARAVTYAIVFGALYTVGLPLSFGPAAGIGLGLLLGLEYGLASGETVGLVFAVVRGGVLGAAGALLYGGRFGVIFGICAAAGLLLVYRLRFSVARDRPGRNGPLIRLEQVRAQAVRVSVIALAAVIAGLGAGIGDVKAIVFALRLAVVLQVTGTVIGSVAPIVERSADEVSTRRLGMVGAVLILVGLLLQSIQYWLVLAGHSRHRGPLTRFSLKAARHVA